MSDIVYQVDNPNNREYVNVNIATWSSTTDVNQFCNTYNYSNGYKNGNNKLSIGNKITINDGTYNATWIIAGFDCEHNAIASDGNSYDNGTGIALIPETYLIKNSYDSSEKGYIGSTIHTTTLPTIANNLKKVLGTHLIERNVLLSSSVNSSTGSTAYTWTKAYCTLMSIGQMTGTFASHKNKYDDGEANYKLPLFNNTGIKLDVNYWLRNVPNSWEAYYVYNYNGTISHYMSNDKNGIRPLIYIR